MLYPTRVLFTEKLRLVNDEPLLIQCDSGVKRSGTFTVIDMCVRQQEKSKAFDVVCAAAAGSMSIQDC